MFEGMYYILRKGVPWRDLPGFYGPWQSVYTRFRRWCQGGIWEKILEELSSESFGRIRSIDCTFVKVHRDGTNPIGGQDLQCIGRTKGGLNTKVAAMVDAQGRVVGLRLACGNQGDLAACKPFFDSVKNQWILGRQSLR